MANSLASKAYQKVLNFVKRWEYSKQPKVFCIGRNKTGTTSMKAIFEELGFAVGPQREAERLMADWGKGRFNRIIKYAKYRGTAFQDTPFSWPGTFQVMAENFPDSKFILTVRDSADIWYNSLINFHAKMFGNGKKPTKADLQNATYVHKGWLWEMNRLMYQTPIDDIYHEATLKQHYLDYNASVIKYFEDKPERLLVVNLKEAGAIEKICSFLNSPQTISEVPWKNKT